MAMAATYFESGVDPAERRALEWLEAASAPALRASESDERTRCEPTFLSITFTGDFSGARVKIALSPAYVLGRTART
jgi:hypothetical protein